MDALADTYEALPSEGRRRLVAAVRADAALASFDPRPVLLAFLGAETDMAAALAILTALGADRPGARGLMAEGGGAILLQPLGGEFFRALVVPAAGQAVQLTDRCRLEDALASAEALVGPSIRPVPLGDAVDAVAAGLWSHLRSGGTLPPGAERFATLFSVDAPRH